MTPCEWPPNRSRPAGEPSLHEENNPIASILVRSNIVVTSLAAVPGAAEAGAALTGVKEVGEAVKNGQEVTHAGAAALAAGAAIAENQQAEGSESG